MSGSLAAAKAARLELEQELDERLAATARPERPTLTVLAQRWLEERAAEPDESRLKESTLARYRQDLERSILPALGECYVDAIEPWQVGDLLTAGGAAQSRRNRRTVLGQLAAYAVMSGYRRDSWMPPVRIRGGKRYSEDEPNLLGDQQIGHLLDVIPRDWACVVWVLALTGMRWGEVSGLLWPDVDLVGRVVRVRRTNWRGTLQPRPKNRAADRVIPLPEPLVERLTAHRQWMIATQHPGLTAGLVFPTATGTPHAGWPLLKIVRRACKDLGYPRLTTHGLRRTYNNLLRQVADGIVVRSIVGHSDEAMTEHCSVVSLAERHEAADRVLTMVRPANVRPECATRMCDPNVRPECATRMCD